MLLGIMGISAFFDNFIALMRIIGFPVIAVAETGRRIGNKIAGLFDSEEVPEEFEGENFMEILLIIFAPIIAVFAGIVGVNNTLNDAADKLYEGLDAFLDKIGLEGDIA